VVALLFSGCATTKETIMSKPTVTSNLTGIHGAARPPKTTWTFDITIENGDEAGWFLLSNPLEHALDAPRKAPGARVGEIDSGQGTVPVLHVMSTNEVMGFHLPAGGKLSLKGVQLDCWLEAGVDAMEVQLARDVSVGGKPIADHWLEGRAMTAPSSASANYDAEKRVFKHVNDNYDTEEVSWTTIQSWSLPLDRSSFPMPVGSAGPETFGPAPDGP
jgi:hypothetical protein